MLPSELTPLVEAGKVDIPKEMGDELRAINEEPPRLASVTDVEAARRRFYDLRTEASRALKALGQMETPNVPSDVPSVQEVKNKLEELRQQNERLVAQKAEADAGWQNAQVRLKSVQAESAEVLTEILSPCEEQEFLKRESERAHAEKVRQEMTELTADQRILEKDLATAQGLNNKCPTCGQPVSAATKAKEIERLRERLGDLAGLI